MSDLDAESVYTDEHTLPITARRIAFAIDADGAIWLAAAEQRSGAADVLVYIGTLDNARIIADGLAEVIEDLTVPDDARELLPKAPTPRDVFGGRS